VIVGSLPRFMLNRFRLHISTGMGRQTRERGYHTLDLEIRYSAGGSLRTRTGYLGLGSAGMTRDKIIRFCLECTCAVYAET
jgi:hypothetical protein